MSHYLSAGAGYFDPTRAHFDEYGGLCYSIVGDGNCCFRALALRLYLWEGQHALARSVIVNYITANPWPSCRTACSSPPRCTQVTTTPSCSARLRRSRQGWAAHYDVYLTPPPGLDLTRVRETILGRELTGTETDMETWRLYQQAMSNAVSPVHLDSDLDFYNY